MGDLGLGGVDGQGVGRVYRPLGLGLTERPPPARLPVMGGRRVFGALRAAPWCRTPLRPLRVDAAWADACTTCRGGSLVRTPRRPLAGRWLVRAPRRPSAGRVKETCSVSSRCTLHVLPGKGEPQQAPHALTRCYGRR